MFILFKCWIGFGCKDISFSSGYPSIGLSNRVFREWCELYAFNSLTYSYLVPHPGESLTQRDVRFADSDIKS